MLRPKQRCPFSILFPQQFNGKNDQAKYKDQQADPVDAVHIPYPFAFRPLGVLFFQVQIFGYLAKYTHEDLTSCSKINA